MVVSEVEAEAQVDRVARSGGGKHVPIWQPRSGAETERDRTVVRTDGRTTRSFRELTILIKMAKNTSLYFRIVEGRSLPAKDV